MYLNVGDVFCEQYPGLPAHYWKVTRFYTSFNNQTSYSVIRCTKNGKEFKDHNGFLTSIDTLFHQSQFDGLPFTLIKRATPVGLKANIDQGISSGKRLRRIQYLENRIANDTKELNQLKG